MSFNVSGASLYGKIDPSQLVVPLEPPKPKIEFNFKKDGTDRGDKSIEKYKMGLTKAKDAIIYLYNTFIEKHKIRTPYGSPLRLLFNINPGNLFAGTNVYGENKARKITAAVIEQGPRSNEFNETIDYADLPQETCTSNIAHEFKHGLEKLAGERISESRTESKVIEAFMNTGHDDIAEYTKLYSGYI